MRCKNEYSLRTRIHMFWGLGPKKKKYKSRLRPCIGDQAPEEAEDDEKGSGPQRGCLALQDNQQRRTPHPPCRWEGQS